ncbi:MAG: GxxExxY protein [Saprospiraceae bacterium]|nr:GxxExxY protein [Saprospiraceae bacterium]MCF8252627.1 GxxExxY protein [Saprospiraceae bacterium]MCF8283116.1 GxxExxY protein [Bacteroidales bacterium]MCF8314202.1 GxxExxY protein [Saprospiraceae bacterium]MCF8443002.1 GxxExxY protein [Saprospiraceae bacterium]
MRENELSYIIRGAIFKVYNYYGPGLLERVYQKAIFRELQKQGMNVKMEVPVIVEYEDEVIDEDGFRIDILVDDLVLIELKSVEELKKVHHKQVMTYLKLTGLKLGLLVNFNAEEISKSIFRKVNGLE